MGEALKPYDDPAYIVSHKTCGKCKWFSGVGLGCVCCHYTLATGKARPLTPVKDCPVREHGKRVRLRDALTAKPDKNARIIVKEDGIW